MLLLLLLISVSSLLSWENNNSSVSSTTISSDSSSSPHLLFGMLFDLLLTCFCLKTGQVVLLCDVDLHSRQICARLQLVPYLQPSRELKLPQ